MSYEFVNLNTYDKVLLVTLNRPDVYNAMHAPMHAELADVWDGFAANPDLWVAVLTGAGEKAFSAGNDLKATAKGGAATMPRTGFAGLTQRFDLEKPVIAAVNGFAMGGGFETALSCDIILAAEHASFALPEIRSGTLADAASIKLPKRIPYHVAMEMLLTGRWIDAEEAARWGLINQIHPTDQLHKKAREMAELLASGPPLVYAAIKEVVRNAEDMRFQDALNKITKSQFATVEKLYNSEDQAEGARAFAEKRDPTWKGQ